MIIFPAKTSTIGASVVNGLHIMFPIIITARLVIGQLLCLFCCFLSLRIRESK